MPRQSLLKASRLIHLYFGVFIAPALIFFAFTGAVQTFGLHETNRDHPNYVPARWLVVLGQIHKKQTPVVNPRKGPPSPSAAGAQEAAAGEHRHKPSGGPGTEEHGASAASAAVGEHHPGAAGGHPEASTADRSVSPAIPAAQPVRDPAAQTGPAPSRHHPLPLRIFFLVAAIGLLTSTLTGLYMAYKYVRNKIAITITLIAGAVIPVLLTLV